MKYNQEFLNELSTNLPYLFWKKLEIEVNKYRKIDSRIPLSTIKDACKVERLGKAKSNGKDSYINKDVIIEKAIALKKSMTKWTMKSIQSLNQRLTYANQSRMFILNQSKGKLKGIKSFNNQSLNN